MIHTIEELSMNAWPTMQTMLYDGWVLRSADGYIKHANSVYPLYPSELNLDVKILVEEARFRCLIHVTAGEHECNHYLNFCRREI